MAIDPALAQLRREQAIKDREVRVYARPDGMADLDAHLTAESAQIITTALDLMAEAAQSAATHAADGRTHQERRADALTSIFAAILDGRPLPKASRTPVCKAVGERYDFKTQIDGAWYRCCGGHVRKLVDCCSHNHHRINGDKSLAGYCYKGRRVFCVMYFQTSVPC